MEGLDVAGGWCPERGRGAPAGRPRIVATYPRQGEVAPAGPITVSVTFDQPMNCGWAIRYDSRRERCTQVGMWDVPARRTWTMACEFGPDREIEINYGDVKGNGFNALAGPLAVPLTLTFRTAPTMDGGLSQAGPGPLASGRSGVLECPVESETGPVTRCRYKPDRVADDRREGSTPAPAP